MRRRAQILEARREMLVTRIATQRLQLAVTVSQLERPIAVAESGWRALRFMREHSLLTAGISAVLLGRSWRRLPLWGGKVFGAWKIARTGWSWWQAYRRTRG